MLKRLLLALLLLPGIANAQFTNGQVLTAAQLNSAFSATLPLAGGTLTGSLTAPSITASGAGSFGTISASTANPSLQFNFGGTGQINRQLQAYLQENPISVIDFGADPTGTTASSVAIQKAVNYACASQSQKIVYEPPGVYLWNSTVTINCDGVKLMGAGGGGYNDNSPAIEATTINRWTGTSGGTALVIQPASNQQAHDNGALGIFWDGNNSLGGIAVDMFSEKYGEFDIRAAHWSHTFVQLDISAAVTENSDTTGNMFYRIAGYQSLAGDGSFLITNSATANNACWNTFVLIQGNWNATPMIVLNGDDNETFVTVNGYNPTPNTPVYGVVLNGGPTDFKNTRHLAFYHLSTTALGGAGVFAQGTDQATVAASGINILYYDVDNQQAAPVVGPGATLWWGSNGAPTGKQAFYFSSSPNGYVQEDNSGKITITGVLAVASGATSGSYTFPTFPGKSAAGFPAQIVNVSATPSTTPVAIAAFSSLTEITVTLPAAAPQTEYFYFMVEGY